MLGFLACLHAKHIIKSEKISGEKKKILFFCYHLFMSIFIFWVIWTTVAALGLKYSVGEMLDRNITFQASFLIMLAYQWIRFAKPTEDSKKSKDTKLPHPNSKKIK